MIGDAVNYQFNSFWGFFSKSKKQSMQIPSRSVVLVNRHKSPVTEERSIDHKAMKHWLSMANYDSSFFFLNLFIVALRFYQPMSHRNHLVIGNHVPARYFF